MNIAVPGKTAGMAGKPFPAGNVQTWGRRSWNHLFWKRPPSSSSPLRCTRLQDRSGCICFSLLLYELKREKKKIVNKQKVSSLSLFVFSWFQAAPSTLSSAGASLWLLFVCRVLLEPWAGGGCGVVPPCSPLHPVSSGILQSSLSFNTV